MKTVLITGVCGFIGSHLYNYFLNENEKNRLTNPSDMYKIIGIDNLISGDLDNIKMDINSYISIHDITDPLEIKEKLDYILHFACPASPVDYYKYPLETLLTCSKGTENMLNLAKENNCPILIASTSEIYGNPLESPQKEEYYGNVNTFGERSCYDEGKRYAETLAMLYKKLFGVKIRIARIFNTYGPRMRVDDGRIIPTLLQQKKYNLPMTIRGDGKQTRSFCYISDMVNGLIKLLHSDYEYPINIGNPEEIDMLSLAKLINPSGEIKFIEALENDPIKRCPDITKAKEILNWEPTVSLEQGLKRMEKNE